MVGKSSCCQEVGVKAQCKCAAASPCMVTWCDGTKLCARTRVLSTQQHSLGLNFEEMQCN
jgi:hypothetical protein